MISIINHLFQGADQNEIMNIYPRLALLTCELKGRDRWSDAYSDYNGKERLYSGFKGNMELLAFFHAVRNTGFLPLARACLEDERMGQHCLNGERFAEAYLFWSTALFQTAGAYTSHCELILQRQRSLIMNETTRRLQTPFRWRKLKQTIRTGTTNYKGRQDFLHSHKRFHLRIARTMFNSIRARVNGRSVHNSPHSSLLLQKYRDSAFSKAKSFIPQVVLDGRSIGIDKCIRGYEYAEYRWGNYTFHLSRSSTGSRIFISL